jgi:hypothetical protein
MISRTGLLKHIILLLAVILPLLSVAQDKGGIRSRELKITGDTLQLDSLSLVPGTIELADSTGAKIDPSSYTVKAAEGLIIFNTNARPAGPVRASYRAFPYAFTKEEKHKDIKNLGPGLNGSTNPFTYTVPKGVTDPFKMEGLNKSGSISRGIVFGNNQDVSVNSNLNLQLSGKLTKDIDIVVAASDDNIPIQPEGNTQQLQEFDKVFIQLSNEHSKLIAGDFLLERPKGYFLNMNKKAQGLNVSTSTLLLPKVKDAALKPEDAAKNFVTLSAAVSRGKFARNQFAGVEGNQGPYRLRGAENELFIIVLSGTERVYLNGVLLARGQEFDYVIDYNTAEITFTPRNLITKDKRIIVEFQYSDKNYARSLVHFGEEYSSGKLNVRFNVFSEQDSKNQPLQQDLTPGQKLLLHDVGDTLELAITPSYDTVAFNNTEVLYERRDTTIGIVTYQRFMYSTNADSVIYRVTFSNVGFGRGNYKQVTSGANGRVFEWVAPVNGVPQGTYEPVIQLITPKKKQMLTLGADYAFSKTTKLSVEGALSKNDLNTFSPHNSGDDVGYAMKLGFDNVKNVFNSDTASKQRWKLGTNINYELVQKFFTPIERFRSVEFERDWNRGTAPVIDDQHITGAGVVLAKDNFASISYRFNAFFEGATYNANRHVLSSYFRNKGFTFLLDGSYLSSKSVIANTNCLRSKGLISQKISRITVGVKGQREFNSFFELSTDTLLHNSSANYEWEGFVQNADTAAKHFMISYKQRNDQLPLLNKYREAMHAEEATFALDLLKNPRSQFRTRITYRTLDIVSPELTAQKPEDALVGRVEYNARALKGLITSNTFYEIGSGLEVKKEFIYLKVAAGQGVYEWVDYNTDSIPQLNEFEIASFRDRAEYIKVFTPTDQYIKTYTNQFSQTLMIRPAAIWMNKKGIRKALALFSDQAAYRVDRKTTNTDIVEAYNPFLQETSDSTLVTLNSTVRNTFFINQMGTVFGADITWQDSRNKSLLTNGFDTRVNTYTESRVRWNLSKKWTVTGSYRNGKKISSSEYFTTRDYNILYNETEPRVSYQPSTTFRASVLFRYTNKQNTAELGGQRAVLQDYGTELRYLVLGKGSFNLKFDYINIAYNDVQNSPLAFEMLSGLKTGENYTWGLVWERTLANNLQLSLTYDGRKSPNVKTIHTGGAQVRAFF